MCFSGTRQSPGRYAHNNKGKKRQCNIMIASKKQFVLDTHPAVIWKEST